MPHQAEAIRTQAQLDELNNALNSGTFVNVRRMLSALPAADIAHLLESSPPPTRHVLWQLVDDEDEGEILQELSDELQSQFLRTMAAEEVAAATEGLEPDDVADLLQQLPEKVLQEVLNSMGQQGACVSLNSPLGRYTVPLGWRIFCALLPS